jgi:hypothetical protein
MAYRRGSERDIGYRPRIVYDVVHMSQSADNSEDKGKRKWSNAGARET